MQQTLEETGEKMREAEKKRGRATVREAGRMRDSKTETLSKEGETVEENEAIKLKTKKGRQSWKKKKRAREREKIR